MDDTTGEEDGGFHTRQVIEAVRSLAERCGDDRHLALRLIGD